MHKILVVCHDAGGGQLLASAVKKYRKEFDWIVATKGPSVNLFKGIQIKRIQNPLDVLRKKNAVDLLLTGTSWGSDVERVAIAEARKAGVSSAAMIDHWVNYKQRFDKKSVMPDSILAGDTVALRLARKIYGRALVLPVENVFFDSVIRGVVAKKNPGLSILYAARASESKVKESARITGAALDRRCFDILLGAVMNHKNWKIIFRPHPSGANFNPVLVFGEKGLSSHDLEISTKRPIINDIQRADVVVGSENMPLAIALLAGKKALSLLPMDEKLPRLPLKGIRRAGTSEKANAEIKRKNSVVDGVFRREVQCHNSKYKWPVILKRIMRYNQS